MVASFLLRLNLEPDRAASGFGLTAGVLLAWFVYATYFEDRPAEPIEIEKSQPLECVSAPYSVGLRPQCVVVRA